MNYSKEIPPLYWNKLFIFKENPFSLAMLIIVEIVPVI